MDALGCMNARPLPLNRNHRAGLHWKLQHGLVHARPANHPFIYARTHAKTTSGHQPSRWARRLHRGSQRQHGIHCWPEPWLKTARCLRPRPLLPQGLKEFIASGRRSELFITTKVRVLLVCAAAACAAAAVAPLSCCAAALPS